MPAAELPSAVATVRRLATRLPEQHATENTEPTRPAAMSRGGVGLVGDGAQSAARAALVGALASGGSHDPGDRGEVVIDTATLAALIGSPATDFESWPRLHIVDDVATAMDLVEVMLLERSRRWDERTVDDLDTSARPAENHELMAPILLICPTPPPHIGPRVKFTVGLAASMNVTAMILGPWVDGTTVTVAADGTTTAPTSARPPVACRTGSVCSPP